MSIKQYVFIVVCICVILVAIGIVLWYRRHTKRILKSLDKMLDDVLCGEFKEAVFDESLQSSVEAKLADYLSASLVSTRNLQEEKNKIKTLIADISHQTKTPIANILLYTQLLEEQELPKESQACVDALGAQAKKLQVLIDALVKSSRLETGILSLHLIRTAIEPVLQEAVRQFSLKAAEKEITLDVEETKEFAVFDPKWTNEAICNLLDNAIKYTPNGGTVSIKVIAYDMFCRIDVSDTGVGIAESEHAKIFSRFYRGIEQQTQEGVGIGLYLTRQIAEGQGGYVKVSSKQGCGSVFSFFLPRG